MTEPTTHEDVLEAIADQPRPVFTASQLAEELPVKRRMTLYKLEDLEERGDVVSMKAGGNARVWYPASLGVWWDQHGETHAFSAYFAGEGDVQEADDRAASQADEDGVGVPQLGESDLPGPVEVSVQEFEPPGGDDLVDDRRDAVRAAYRYLEDEGPASTADFLEDVYPEHTAGYEAPQDRKGGWWRSTVKPGLEALPGVVKPDGGQPWRLRG